MDNPEQTLQDQMDKPPGDSKKLGMVKFGVYVICAVYAVGATVFMIKPDGQIVILTQIVVGAIAGLIGIYCGAQATVDFNNASSLASVVESKKSEVEIRNITEEIIRAPKASHFDGEDIP